MFGTQFSRFHLRSSTRSLRDGEGDEDVQRDFLWQHENGVFCSFMSRFSLTRALCLYATSIFLCCLQFLAPRFPIKTHHVKNEFNDARVDYKAEAYLLRFFPMFKQIVKWHLISSERAS